MNLTAAKVAAVTGGGAGIGEAICHRLSAEGAQVAVIDLSLPAAKATVDAIGSGIALRADVSNPSSMDDAVKRIEAELGPLQVFVNNAGAVALDHVKRIAPALAAQRTEVAATGRAETPLDALVRLTDAEWRLVLSVHLDGTFHGTRAAARAMAPRGGGAIVNMASICGIEGWNGHPHYSAAKAGVLGFTKAAAKELIVQGIRVNAVAPGHVGTTTLQG